MNDDLNRALGHSLWLGWTMHRSERGEYLEKWAKGWHKGTLATVRATVRAGLASWEGVGYWFRHYRISDRNRYATRGTNNP